MAKEKKQKAFVSPRIAEMNRANRALHKQLAFALEQMSLYEHTQNRLKDNITQKDRTIRDQAKYIEKLTKELETERNTLELRHQEIDGLYRRNWWQRLLNLAPSEL